MEWVLRPDGHTTEHWLSVVEKDGLADGHNLRAEVKWDGCVHLNRDYLVDAGKEANTDYIHICDLDQFIGELQALSVKAKAHFGDPWPC